MLLVPNSLPHAALPCLTIIWSWYSPCWTFTLWEMILQVLVSWVFPLFASLALLIRASGCGLVLAMELLCRFHCLKVSTHEKYSNICSVVISSCILHCVHSFPYLFYFWGACIVRCSSLLMTYGGACYFLLKYCTLVCASCFYSFFSSCNKSSLARGCATRIPSLQYSRSPVSSIANVSYVICPIVPC